MGIDAHFYVRTERDMTDVFNDMWWKTDGEIYVRKVPLGYEWYNLDRYYSPEYRRGYMPRLFVMFQVMNQNLQDGEAIYYCGDNYAYDDFLKHEINEPTSLEEMTALLLDWCAFMGISHLHPGVRWNVEHPPDGYGTWNRTPQVVDTALALARLTALATRTASPGASGSAPVTHGSADGSDDPDPDEPTPYGPDHE